MRVPNSPPTISIEDSVTSIDNINFNDIHLFDYNPQDAINAEVSV
jgi:thymidylate synthase